MDSYPNDAIALLPEEVWKYILDFAVTNNDQTIQICNLTCNLWYQNLKHYNFRLKFATVLPYLYPYLSGSDILNCRLVSKKWSTAVNLCNPKVEPKIKLDLNRYGNQLLGELIHYFFRPPVRHLPHQREDNVVRNIQEFDFMRPRWRRNLQEIRSYFLFQSLRLSVSRNMKITIECIPCLNEIRAFEVHFSDGLIRRNISMLQVILSKVKSLEYLKLTSADPTERILPEVLLNIQFSQLHKLKKLNVTQVPSVFAEYLITHFKSTLLANNKQPFDICQVLDRRENLFWWKGPIKLLNTQMGERSFTHVHFSIASESYPLCKIEDKIQQYRNTLRVLSIKWIGLKQRGARFSGEMGLKSINVNWSTRTSLESSFEFLKELRNLEQLKIQFRIEDYKNLGQIKKNITNRLFLIDFENNLEEIEDLMDDDIVIRKLYKSNIWSLMQRLKRVCISIVNDEQIEDYSQMTRVYTRRDLNELYPNI